MSMNFCVACPDGCDPGICEFHQQILRDEKTLSEVKSKVGDEFYQLILQQIEESEGAYNLEIIDSPIGRPQHEDGIEIWIDQHSCGCSGDCFSGTICTKLPDGKYLKWDFSM